MSTGQTTAEKIRFTEQDLNEVNADLSEQKKKELVAYFNDALDNTNALTTELEKKQVLAQLKQEGNLTKTSENMVYSAPRLHKVFPHKMTAAQALVYLDELQYSLNATQLQKAVPEAFKTELEAKTYIELLNIKALTGEPEKDKQGHVIDKPVHIYNPNITATQLATHFPTHFKTSGDARAYVNHVNNTVNAPQLQQLAPDVYQTEAAAQKAMGTQTQIDGKQLHTLLPHDKRFDTERKATAAIVKEHAHARIESGIANFVYANKTGNGDIKSGDGWTYHGRGLIQVTGKDNYKEMTARYNKEFGTTYDFVKNPELLQNNLEIASKTAFVFWAHAGHEPYTTKEAALTDEKLKGLEQSILAKKVAAHKQLPALEKQLATKNDELTDLTQASPQKQSPDELKETKQHVDAINQEIKTLKTQISHAQIDIKVSEDIKKYAKLKGGTPHAHLEAVKALELSEVATKHINGMSNTIYSSETLARYENLIEIEKKAIVHENKNENKNKNKIGASTQSNETSVPHVQQPTHATSFVQPSRVQVLCEGSDSVTPLCKLNTQRQYEALAPLNKEELNTVFEYHYQLYQQSNDEFAKDRYVDLLEVTQNTIEGHIPSFAPEVAPPSQAALWVRT